MSERWFPISVCTVIMLLIGFGLAQLWPSAYESDTLFVLRSSKLVDDSAFEKSVNPVALAAKQRTLMNELTSHSRLTEVLRELAWIEFIKAQMDQKSYQNFLNKVSSSIRVEIFPDAVGDTQVKLFFSWNDPMKARDFCDKMRDIWIDNKLENYKQDYTARLEKAEALLRERREKLAKDKQALEKFDAETFYASIGTLEELNRQKTDLMLQCGTDRAKVRSLDMSVKDLENELVKIPQKIPEENQKKNPEWVKAYKDWQLKFKRYQLKRERLTDANPDLVRLKEEVQAAQEYLDELEPEKYITEGLNEKINPEYTNKSAELTKLKPQLADSRERLTICEEQLADIEEKITILPGLTAERQYLEDEIELSKEKCHQAEIDIQPLRDRVSAFSSVRRVGPGSRPVPSFKSQTFEVLQYALAAKSPKNPMGLIIVIGFTLVGLGLGLILSLAGEFLKGSFSTQEEVISLLKKPVLGGVNRIMTAAELRAIKWRKVLFASSSLLVIFSLIAIIYICNNYPHLIPTAIVEQVNQIRESLG
jgi:uncharacterized protein involved in exopolysaccharide biosynthesis